MKKEEIEREYWNMINESKIKYEKNKLKLTFEEKLKILVKLQEEAYFFGRTKVKPWKLD